MPDVLWRAVWGGLMREGFDSVLLAELQGGPESKLQAERIAALQERKQLLEALLSSRVGELRHVCLQEAVSSIDPLTL